MCRRDRGSVLCHWHRGVKMRSSGGWMLEGCVVGRETQERGMLGISINPRNQKRVRGEKARAFNTLALTHSLNTLSCSLTNAPFLPTLLRSLSVCMFGYTVLIILFILRLCTRGLEGLRWLYFGFTFTRVTYTQADIITDCLLASSDTFYNEHKIVWLQGV